MPRDHQGRGTVRLCNCLFHWHTPVHSSQNVAREGIACASRIHGLHLVCRKFERIASLLQIPCALGAQGDNHMPNGQISFASIAQCL